MWLISSPETFSQLSDGLNLTIDRYERWVYQTLAATLLDELPPDS